MKSRWTSVGIAALLIVLVGGGVYYTRNQTAAQPQRARDPGFGVILAIRTLERSPETQLSKEQIARILPFVKALKDIPTTDAEATAVIAKTVTDTFTPAQKAALEEARTRFLERQRSAGAQAGGPPGASGEGAGVGGPPGASAGPGAGPTDKQRAQFRMRTFERMIRYLERRS